MRDLMPPPPVDGYSCGENMFFWVLGFIGFRVQCSRTLKQEFTPVIFQDRAVMAPVSLWHSDVIECSRDNCNRSGCWASGLGFRVWGFKGFSV